MKRHWAWLGLAVLAACGSSYAVGLPFSVEAVSQQSGDALAASALGALKPDAALQKMGDEILAYTDKPEDLKLRFVTVESARPAVLSLPNGAVYIARPVLTALAGDPEQVSYLLATLGALAVDGKTRDDETVGKLVADTSGPLPATFIQAVESTLTAERVHQADRLAMLCLARAGMPPLEAVRALDKLGRLGTKNLCVTTAGTQMPSLLERKVQSTRDAAELIKAATDFDFAIMDLVEKRYEDAIPRLKSFLQVLPDNYAGWNNLGLCYYHLAVEPLGPPRFLLADAIAEFDTSYFTRGKREPDMVQWQAALDSYRRAAMIDPLRVEALNNLGNLYSVRGDYAKARHYYDLALAQRGDYAPALNNYGVALAEEATGDFPKEALARFTAAAEADPTMPEAQFNLGQARAELALPGSESAYTRYLALAPNGTKAVDAMRALGRGEAARQPTGQGPVLVAEDELELWNRVRLALTSPRRELFAMVAATPDQQRQLPIADTSLVGWSQYGLVVELVSNKVNRVVAGRPPGHEAKTERGVQVGYSLDEIKTKYGPPPAVSKQSPYDIWLYPRTGLGFFVLNQQVSKIFMFQVAKQ